MESKNLIKKLEKLYHFSCSYCSKWWSIGDAPEKKKNWYCPWCGKEHTVKI